MNAAGTRYALRGWHLVTAAMVIGCSASKVDAQTAGLASLSQAVETVSRTVSPSVVQILVTRYGARDSSERTNVVYGWEQRVGSGVIVIQEEAAPSFRATGVAGAAGGRRVAAGSVVSVVAAGRVAEAARAAVGRCARTIFLAGSITIE